MTSKEYVFGKNGKKHYVVRRFDDHNVIIEKYYISTAKGHEGKLVSKVHGYYSTFALAIDEVARLQLEVEVFGEDFKSFKKSLKELKEYYKKNN